ncbi:hypothetical protein ACS0TY_025842 [Phlomoides rotata]
MGARCEASVFHPGKRWAATSVSTTVVVKLAPGSSVITSLSLQIRTGISTSMRLLPRFILRNSEEDIWRWRHTRDGLFSTASVYQNLGKAKFTEPDEQTQLTAFHRLWNSYAPRRYQAIVWKLLHN